LSPVFVISLPRSGSTLLTRLLAANENIATHAEPWFMLPLIYMPKKEGVSAVYSHSASSRAIRDVVKTLAESNKDWNQIVRKIALDIYSSLSSSENENCQYFLDKTPRYHLIVNDLASIFPEAKFIILTRDPLSCLSSGIETWGKGQMRLHGQWIDLLEGPKNLAGALTTLKDRCIKISYEDLTEETDKTLIKLYEFLLLDYDEETLSVQASIRGSMGDPKADDKSKKQVDAISINKYKKTLGTAYRKGMAKRYINKLDEKDLNILGYSKEELFNRIDALPSSCDKLLGDVVIGFASWLWQVFDFGFLRRRLLKIKSGKFPYIEN
jgi:hypothetical protein